VRFINVWKDKNWGPCGDETELGSFGFEQKLQNPNPRQRLCQTQLLISWMHIRKINQSTKSHEPKLKKPQANSSF